MATAATPPPDAPPAPPADGETLHEVVQGQIVEKPPMGAYEAEIATLLIEFLAPFVRTRQLGKVLGEALFRIDAAANLERRPDVAFVANAQWPWNRRAPLDSAWDIVPDLAIEVVNPSNTATEVVARVEEYLRAGVTRVWAVYPREPLILVYESPTSIHVLRPGDELDGAPLLPGFRLPLTTLFADEAKQHPAP